MCVCVCFVYKESYSKHLLNIFSYVELMDQRMFLSILMNFVKLLSDNALILLDNGILGDTGIMDDG